MLILVLFAFLAGVVTILSPCILPVLPIVLSSSLTGGKRRPLGIVTGFVMSFTFFTLLLSAIVRATGISAASLRDLAILMIGGFGVSLFIPNTQVLLEKLFSKFSNTYKPTTGSGYGSGVLVGLSIGLLWTPCVGPILASVITLALTGSTNFSAFLITLAYSIGTGLPMLAITYGGRQLLQRNQWLLANTARIQTGFGVIMIAMAVALWFNVDRQIQTILLRTFPAYGTGLTAIENNPLVQKQLGNSPSTLYHLPTATLPDLGPNPNPTFSGATHWLNSEPLNFNTNLKGKVVLVDFWTYSCINCIRTLPYLTSWYAKYKEMGFVIVGVHSPEFEFEKDASNVTQALKDFGITYPVAQDNNLSIWNSYQNQYWPAHYLFDGRGRLRDTHFGEGDYDVTEKNIQALLVENGTASSSALPTVKPQAALPLVRFGEQITPETYLGSNRKNPDDGVSVSGAWTDEGERITSGSDTSTVTLHFYAAKVYLVMGGKSNKAVLVKLDGKPYGSPFVITMDKKYDIVDLGSSASRHTVELTVPSGISAYAFTFGE